MYTFDILMQKLLLTLLYVNGILHREDGPAVHKINGTKFWLFNGKYHRLGGPAIELASGHKQWWINGVRLSPEKEAIMNMWWYDKNGI